MPFLYEIPFGLYTDTVIIQRKLYRFGMPSSRFHVPANATHESMGAVLFAGGMIAVALLAIILYFLWRDRGRRKSEKDQKNHRAQEVKARGVRENGET